LDTNEKFNLKTAIKTRPDQVKSPIPDPQQNALGAQHGLSMKVRSGNYELSFFLPIFPHICPRVFLS
jgi:hypothetical protein